MHFRGTVSFKTLSAWNHLISFHICSSLRAHEHFSHRHHTRHADDGPALFPFPVTAAAATQRCCLLSLFLFFFFQRHLQAVLFLVVHCCYEHISIMNTNQNTGGSRKCFSMCKCWSTGTGTQRLQGLLTDPQKLPWTWTWAP